MSSALDTRARAGEAERSVLLIRPPTGISACAPNIRSLETAPTDLEILPEALPGRRRDLLLFHAASPSPAHDRSRPPPRPLLQAGRDARL